MLSGRRPSDPARTWTWGVCAQGQLFKTCPIFSYLRVKAQSVIDIKLWRRKSGRKTPGMRPGTRPAAREVNHQGRLH
jgi:hypothetical protein